MRRRRVDISLVILLVLVAVGEIIAIRKQPSLPLQALSQTVRLFRGVWLDLLLGFVLAGLVEVLLPAPALSRWLGTESPARGILVGWGLGLVLPGGPYFYFPVVAGLFQKGAAPGPLITLVTGKTLISPIRTLAYEAPLLGWPFALARFLPGLLLPPVMGIIGAWLFAVLGGSSG